MIFFKLLICIISGFRALNLGSPFGVSFAIKIFIFPFNFFCKAINSSTFSGSFNG